MFWSQRVCRDDNTVLRFTENRAGPGNPLAPIHVNAFRITNFRSQSAMHGVEFHGNTRRDSTTRILSILLKAAFKVLAVELTHLINESIRTSSFPDTWAVGSITPILKEGDPLDPGNWRPISILPLPSKLLERAIHYQIISHLDNNNISLLTNMAFERERVLPQQY